MDSLDLGLYVRWGTIWPDLSEKLEAQKKAAYGTDGIVWHTHGGREYVFYPAGMGKQYRYHFQIPCAHIFVSSTAEAKHSPNVFASISAQSLWLNGLESSCEAVCEAVRELMGIVMHVQVSRCDVCADFRIPGGLSEAFIDEHLVSRGRKDSCYRNGGVLETYYLGGKGSPLQLRIYDKSKEVLAKGNKLWFLDLWNVGECRDVWRVEFQLRRAALRGLGIDGPDSLQAKLGGLWRYLTSEWVSLRLPDDDNAARRSLHPWWQEVTECSARFGQVEPVSRIVPEPGPPDMGRTVRMMAGHLVSFAAAVGRWPFPVAWDLLGQELLARVPAETLEERIRLRRAKWGLSSREESAGVTGEDVPF